MGLQCCLQVVAQAFTLVLGERGRALEALLRSLCQGGNGAAQLQELLFGLAHQRHGRTSALTAALAPKAAHNLLEGLVERLCLGLQRGRLRGPSRRRWSR